MSQESVQNLCDYSLDMGSSALFSWEGLVKGIGLLAAPRKCALSELVNSGRKSSTEQLYKEQSSKEQSPEEQPSAEQSSKEPPPKELSAQTLFEEQSTSMQLILYSPPESAQMALERLQRWSRASTPQPDRPIFQNRSREPVRQPEDHILDLRTVFARLPPPPHVSDPEDSEDSEEQFPSTVSFINESPSRSPLTISHRPRFPPLAPLRSRNYPAPEDSDEQLSTDVESIEWSSAGEDPESGLDERDEPPWSPIGSGAKDDWDYQKSSWGTPNAALDSLMGMIGLEVVKAKFVEINNLIATAKRQRAKVSKEKFGIVFIGNPGTG